MGPEIAQTNPAGNSMHIARLVEIPYFCELPMHPLIELVHKVPGIFMPVVQCEPSTSMMVKGAKKCSYSISRRCLWYAKLGQAFACRNEFGKGDAPIVIFIQGLPPSYDVVMAMSCN